jgi:LPS export ABC transporter protein LptC
MIVKGNVLRAKHIAVRKGSAFGLAALVLALAGCQDEDAGALNPPELLETGADMVMEGLEFIITRDGVKDAEVFADTAYVYNDSSFYRLRNPVLILFTEQGLQRARVTADQGRFRKDTREMFAQGNVVLTINEGNRRVESSELNYDPSGDRIWSDSLTVLREAGTVSEGLGFDSDLDFRRLNVGPGSIRNTGDPGGQPGGREPPG